MERRQKQAIEAFERVQAFLDAHPVESPAGYGEPRKLLDAVVDALRRHTTTQAAGGRQGRAETKRQKALARQLRELHLRPIAKIARAVLDEVPGIELALRIPSAQIPAMRLLAEARAVRKCVAPHEAAFVTNGRPADFLAQLDGAIEALNASFVGRARLEGGKVGARLGLTQQLRRGRNALELLDAIVTTTFASDFEVLGQWRSARRVRALPGGGSQEQTTPAPEAAPAAAA